MCKWGESPYGDSKNKKEYNRLRHQAKLEEGRAASLAYYYSNRERYKQYYSANKDKIIEAKLLKRGERDKWLGDIKTGLGCYTCGESDPVCLDFHHKDPSTKVNGISEMLAGYPIAAILEEIAKCILICSNCHRKLHREHLSLLPLPSK